MICRQNEMLRNQQIEDAEHFEVVGIKGEQTPDASRVQNRRQLCVEDAFAAELKAVHPVEAKLNGFGCWIDRDALVGCPPRTGLYERLCHRERAQNSAGIRDSVQVLTNYVRCERLMLTGGEHRIEYCVRTPMELVLRNIESDEDVRVDPGHLLGSNLLSSISPKMSSSGCGTGFRNPPTDEGLMSSAEWRPSPRDNGDVGLKVATGLPALVITISPSAGSFCTSSSNCFFACSSVTVDMSQTCHSGGVATRRLSR